MIGETAFTVPNQGATFEWNGYGLKFHVPEGSLPVGMGECRVNIRLSLSGQFQLPEDTYLLSPVFWISAPCKSIKPVTLEIQHYALREDETVLSDLSFVSAKDSQKDLPYKFKQLDGPSKSPSSPDVLSVSVQVSRTEQPRISPYDNLPLPPPPRNSPTPQPESLKPAIPPKRTRSHSNVADVSYNSTLEDQSAWIHEPERTHEKVVTRGDDQAGLLDHELTTNSEFDSRFRRGSDEANVDTHSGVSPSSTKRPVPKPRVRTGRSRTVLGCGVQVNVQLNDL